MTLFLMMIVSLSAFSLERPEIEFKVFQFPQNQMPRIDGDPSDWTMVPDGYSIGLDQLEDTMYHVPANPKDKDITVTVGWVKGMSRLYFLIRAYDDYWDFNQPGLHNDIFELVVDGDLSGGGFLPRDHPATDSLMTKWQKYTAFHSVHAQNYHVFLPAEGKPWTMVWGCQPWIYHFPWANCAYSYSFSHGESGDLVAEFWITPFDHASYDGPERSAPSKLAEDSIIGISWSVLEYDGEHDTGRYKAFWNLSHKTTMLGNASDLCAFRLMPLEMSLKKPIGAEWSYAILDLERRVVAFTDESWGAITKWTWDFDDGTVSNERSPVHTYDSAGYYRTVVLTVEGPDGTSRMAKVTDVAVP